MSNENIRNPNVRRFRPHRFSPAIEQELKRLSKSSAWRATAAVAEDWILICTAIWAAIWSISAAPVAVACITLPIAWLIIGCRMRALATLLHEASHRAIARSRKVNLLFGTVLSGWWIGQVHWRYHQSHVEAHHPWLGHPKRDPDTVQYLRLGLLTQDPATFLWRNLLQLLLGVKSLGNLPYLLRDRLLPAKGNRLTLAQAIETAGFFLAWSMLLGLLACMGWLGTFMLVWVVPYLTTFQAINWLIETSEHFPLIWTENDPFNHTRNRKGPPIEQFLTGAHGENWHRVHHERPGIPFWNLAKAHAAMMGDPAYAEAERQSAGLFFSGPNGEPSILRAMARQLEASQRNRAGEGEA